jgi:hypothetical protein
MLPNARLGVRDFVQYRVARFGIRYQRHKAARECEVEHLPAHMLTARAQTSLA